MYVFIIVIIYIAADTIEGRKYRYIYIYIPRETIIISRRCDRTIIIIIMPTTTIIIIIVMIIMIFNSYAFGEYARISDFARTTFGKSVYARLPSSTHGRLQFADLFHV